MERDVASLKLAFGQRRKVKKFLLLTRSRTFFSLQPFPASEEIGLRIRLYPFLRVKKGFSPRPRRRKKISYIHNMFHPLDL